jgi:hypothetical protein
MLLDKLG